MRGQLRLLFPPSHQALFALLIIQTLHPVANGRLMTATQAGVDKGGWERYLCLGGARKGAEFRKRVPNKVKLFQSIILLLLEEHWRF